MPIRSGLLTFPSISLVPNSTAPFATLLSLLPPKTMKVTLILALAGIGAAAPAAISKFASTIPPTHLAEAAAKTAPVVKPTDSPCIHPCLYDEPLVSATWLCEEWELICRNKHDHRAEFDDTDSSDDEAAAATPMATTIRTLPVLPCTSWGLFCHMRWDRRAELDDTNSSDDEASFPCKPPLWTFCLRAEFDDTDSSDDGAEAFAVLVATATETCSLVAPSATGLNEDLESFEISPAYSRLVEEQSDIPYPYELVIENRNKTAIHQAIQTFRSEVPDGDYNAYDTNECAQTCNEHLTCDAFAIYVERDSSWTDCSAPEAIEVAKCDIFNTALTQPYLRKEAAQNNIQGQTITRAIRAYNDYKIQKTATATAVRTTTVQSQVVAYSTATITTTSPVISTMHHTMASSSSIITRTAPASTFTRTMPTTIVTETYVDMAPTVTLTETSTKPTATVTTGVVTISTTTCAYARCHYP